MSTLTEVPGVAPDPACFFLLLGVEKGKDSCLLKFEYKSYLPLKFLFYVYRL